MIAILVTTIAVCGFLSSIVASLGLNATSRRATVGSEVAQEVLETLYAENLANVFAMYNDDPLDDPVGGAPGSNFVVSRSSWEEANADGLVATILFPTPDAAPGSLREDVFDLGLGMPRDLNGDGLIDGLDHSGDYVVLPVRVQIEWPTGERFSVCALLGGL